MAESLELLLPELLTEDFKQGWTRFEFVATAKGWNAKRQLARIPTLLRGKLINDYVELPDATKTDLNLLKAALQDRAGVKEDPLVASKQFNQQSQGPEEKVKDFAATLKRLFKDAYPTVIGFSSTTPMFSNWTTPRNWPPATTMKQTRHLY